MKKGHDLEFKDIPQFDLDCIKSRAISDFVNTRESSQVNLIVNQFMGYLQSKGYRIVKLDKGKKLQFSGVLAHLDGKPDSTGDSFAVGCIVGGPEKNIPISHNFQKGIEHHLGWAKVYKNKGKLYYTMDLHTELPPELANMLRPCLGGSIVERDKNIIKRMNVSCIGLAMENADDRILPLTSTKDHEE